MSLSSVFKVVPLVQVGQTWNGRHCFNQTSGSESSGGGSLPTVESSSSLSSRYVDFLTNSGGLEQRQLWPTPMELRTNQYACFRHCLSFLTTLTISPLSLFSRPSNANVSTTTYPPRLSQIWDRKRDGISTNSGSFTNGSSTQYKLFPSAFLTRAIACPSSKIVGGAEVSAAVASRLRFGRAISACFSAVNVALALQEGNRCA